MATAIDWGLIASNIQNINVILSTDPTISETIGADPGLHNVGLAINEPEQNQPDQNGLLTMDANEPEMASPDDSLSSSSANGIADDNSNSTSVDSSNSQHSPQQAADPVYAQPDSDLLQPQVEQDQPESTSLSSIPNLGVSVQADANMPQIESLSLLQNNMQANLGQAQTAEISSDPLINSMASEAGMIDAQISQGTNPFISTQVLLQSPVQVLGQAAEPSPEVIDLLG